MKIDITASPAEKLKDLRKFLSVILVKGHDAIIFNYSEKSFSCAENGPLVIDSGRHPVLEGTRSNKFVVYSCLDF